MLNARDGGIGGAKVVLEECETAYNAQKGVECYEATKGKGALVYNPLSTGITLQLIPKAPVDETTTFSSNSIPGKDTGTEPVAIITLSVFIKVSFWLSSLIEISFFDLKLPVPLK